MLLPAHRILLSRNLVYTAITRAKRRVLPVGGKGKRNTLLVTSGLCAGMALEQIAKKRPANLRYYVFSDATSNILKAAARLVLDSLTVAKAG